MLRNFAVRILIRWLANAFGIWLASQVISSIMIVGDELEVVLLAGFILSLLNAVIRPLIVLISLPFIVFSLGLFLVVVNGLMVWAAHKFIDSFVIDGFGTAVIAGIIIGLVNYAVTTLLEDGKVLKK